MQTMPKPDILAKGIVGRILSGIREWIGCHHQNPFHSRQIIAGHKL